MKEKLLMLIVLLLSTHNLLFADITLFDEGSNKVDLTQNTETNISLDYQLNSISARDYSSLDGQFIQLSAESFGLTGELGKPQLPYNSKIIAVPEGAKVVTELKADSSILINLSERGMNNKVFPAQAPVSKSSKPEDIVFEFDAKTYRSGDFIPQEQVEVIELGYLRGMRLFEVNYYPVTYNPKTNTLKIVTQATLDIQFAGADLTATQYLRDKTFSPAFEANYPATIFNYLPNRSTLESYPLGYIIVAPSNYLTTLTPFIQWKTEQGYAVTVLNTSTIGSTTANIQSAIASIWNNASPSNPAPSYLLICGDVAQVPAFTGATDSAHITDLNYVRLAGSDYLPEMYYGRFSAINTTELTTMVNKTLLYEKYEMPDPSYLERVTMIAGVDGNWAPTHGNGTINYGSQNYFNSAHGINATTYPYPASGSSASSILADVSAGLGYLNYTAHGSETTWHDPSFTISNINNLTNAQQYPVVVGNCCLTNKFQVGTCFGEAWLRATNGSVIYIGGTNSTYWDEDYWWSVGHFTPTSTANPTYAGTSPGMFDALFHDHGQAYVNWANSAGSMIYRGNMAVQASSSSRKNYYWEIYSIMGDPSLIPYIGIPEAQSPNYANNLMIGATSLNVTAAPYSYVSLTVNGVIIGTQLLGSSGSGTISFPALSTTQAVKMVISRVDYQPYMVEIPVITANGPYLTLASYTVNDNNNNGLLEYGETGSLNLVIENIGTATSNSGTITFSESDPYLTLNTASASINTLSANNTLNLNNVIAFTLANNIPNNHTMTLAYVISANGEQYPGNISLTGKSYQVVVTGLTINDSALGNGNSVIDIGETFAIVATIQNNGGAISPANSASIQNANYISYANNSATIPAIAAGSSQTISFTATASNSISAGELVTFTVNSNYPNGSVQYSQAFLAALLQIGEGTVTNASLPMEPYYGYSYSQTIYTASELNLGTSNINKIAYHYNGNSAWTDNIVIYMGNTSKTNFTSTTNWVNSANLSQVYSGSFAVPASAGWVEIVLTNPFIYDGSSNLVIGFDENTSGYHGSGDEFYCYASGSNRSIYYYNDSTNPNPVSPPTARGMSVNNPNIRIFATATTSEPNISLNTTSLDFGEVIIGSSVTRDFTISNTGGATLTGTITLPNSFSFASRDNAKEVTDTQRVSQNFSIPSGNSSTYSVTFIPTVELCYNGNITINNNAGEYPAYISLVACGVKPTYASTTRLISKTLDPNTQSTYDFIIQNTGSGDLEVLVEITDAERNSGGPDTYGYTWKDSNESGVDYNWLDISSTGTVVANGDDTSQSITLPFTFNFYGVDYTTVNVCSNGFLSFTSTSTAYTNQTIPNSTAPNAVIAPFWDDFKPIGGTWGSIYHQNFTTYSVIQWENTSHWSSSSPSYNETFQVILYNNGDIKYQYKTVANASSCTVGIENQAGNDGLQLTYNSAFLANQYAILFTNQAATNSWLSLSTDNLIIPEGSSETITLSFDSTDLELATYNKNLYVLTNDPDHAEITIPVTLIVGGTDEPNILVNTQALDFGTVMVSDLALETLTITNLGAETLIGNISASNSFTISEARTNVSKNVIKATHQGSKRFGNFDFSLATGATKSYDISHATTVAGSYSGEIVIASNDPEDSQVSIPLTLEVVRPASVSVNLQSLALNLQTEETAIRTLRISNSGDLDLNCTLSLQANEDRDVFEIFSANFDDHNLSTWNINYLSSPAYTWHIVGNYAGYDLNDSSFLFIDSDAAGSGIDFDDTIETPIFNISGYEEITIEFDHYFNQWGSEIADVDFWTGSEWINLERWQGSDIGYWSDPNHFTYNLTNAGYSNVKLRFHYYDANYEYYWAIDNLLVTGERAPAPQWVTMDSQFNSFTLAPHSNEEIILNFTTADFAAGDYSATLNIQSNSSTNSSLDIPISLTIRALENEPNWQPVIYPNNSATIYAEVSQLGNEVAANDLVSAWVGNECRGVGNIVIVRSQAFTTIVTQSNGSQENVYFKFYDRSADAVIVESNSTTIASGQVLGSAQTPFPIYIGLFEECSPNNVIIEISNSRANITWNAIPTADYYKVFYSTDLTNWAQIGQTSATSYQHNQPRSQAHFYKVQAGKN